MWPADDQFVQGELMSNDRNNTVIHLPGGVRKRVNEQHFNCGNVFGYRLTVVIYNLLHPAALVRILGPDVLN
jgi:hypothetical protein